MANILLAEDEDFLRRNLAFLLNSSGYSTFPVRTSIDAIELLKTKPFDLVITDLIMPVKGGEELISYISENCSETAIIIITAYPTAESAIKAVKKGVVDYFTKPFKTDEILKAVQKALESKKEVPFAWDKLNTYGITKREQAVLRLVVEGGITEHHEIAEKLSIKVTTVKQHLENVYSKFNVNNKASLIAEVIKILRK